MTYIFDASEEYNDLLEVDSYVNYHSNDGFYYNCNRTDENGHLIYSFIFYDKRYALLFKTKFNVTVVTWDESNDETIVTEEELLDRGYQAGKLRVLCLHIPEFMQWCKDRDFAIMDEIKLTGVSEPFTIYAPRVGLMLANLVWAV